jgi:hypothetical protein
LAPLEGDVIEKLVPPPDALPLLLLLPQATPRMATAPSAMTHLIPFRMLPPLLLIDYR